MASVDEFTRYMRESGQQSRLDELGKTGGGIEQAAAQWGGPSSSQSTQSYSPTTVQNPVDIAKQMYELANQFKQPAINTLQGQASGINTAYQGLSTAAAAQKPNIEQRYQDTLKEITQATRGAAASEFTRRGIPLSSGLVEQTVGSRLAPQIASAATQRDTNLLGVDQLLADIGMGQQTSQTSLAQAIAAIQAASSGEAISSAQNIYGQQQTANQNALQNQLQQQQLALQTQVANQPNTQVVEAGGRKLLVNSQTGATIQDLGSSTSGTTSGGITAADFLKLMGGRNTVTYPSSWSTIG